MTQAEVVEVHALLVVPDRNINVLPRELKAPVSYNIQERLRLIHNSVHHAYEFRRIQFGGILGRVTADIIKENASGSSRLAWVPVLHGSDFPYIQIDAWAWPSQGIEPGSSTGGKYVCGNVTMPHPECMRPRQLQRHLQSVFQTMAWGRKEEGTYG